MSIQRIPAGPEIPNWFFRNLVPNVIASVLLIIIGWFVLLILYKFGFVDARSRLALRILVIEIPRKTQRIFGIPAQTNRLEPESSDLELPNPAGDLYLVTGTFFGDRELIEHAKSVINDRGDDTAFSLDEVEPDINLDVKFDLIAARVDHIIIVASEVGPGLSQEITTIRSNISYYRKTYVLCQESSYYEFSNTHQELLESVNEAGRLFEWSKKEDLNDILEQIS